MIAIIGRHVIPAALSLLPPAMDTPAARAMLLAIGLQESRFLYRRQKDFGPARGFWQFEKNGAVRGVVNHQLTRGPLNAALRALRYPELVDRKPNQTATLHQAIQENDILACVFARLNLWWLPGSLPGRHQVAAGWEQYIAAWQPGRPHPDTWPAFFEEAWERIELLEKEPKR